MLLLLGLVRPITRTALAPRNAVQLRMAVDAAEPCQDEEAIKADAEIAFALLDLDGNGYSVHAGEPMLKQRDFQRLLLSAENSIVDPAHARVHMDMTKPLSSYLIFSSHNTFLTGNQFSSDSSADMYRRVWSGVLSGVLSVSSFPLLAASRVVVVVVIVVVTISR